MRYDIPSFWHTSLGLSIVIKLTYKVYKLYGLSKTVGDGFEIIEEICKAHNCELVVLNKEDKTPEHGLIGDLTSILVSFSGKLYDMRSHKYEEEKKCVEELKA